MEELLARYRVYDVAVTVLHDKLKNAIVEADWFKPDEREIALALLAELAESKFWAYDMPYKDYRPEV
jgi:hypothetical protein